MSLALPIAILLTVCAFALPAKADAHTITNPICAANALAKARETPPATRAEFRLRYSVCRTMGLRHNKAHFRNCSVSYWHYRTRNECVIRKVWGPVGQADNAVRVARCESSLRTWASNGQYLGMFQMGRAERARFGHGRDPWTQSRSALAYYRLAGWRPWECKPW